MIRVLLTGGTGFIGAELAKVLLKAECSLTFLSRRPDKIKSLFGDSVLTISTFTELSDADIFDVVINLAGEPIADRPWTANRKRILRESRVSLTRSLLTYLERVNQKPSLLINASAVGFYGNQGDQVLDEGSGVVDDFAHQLCRDWEQQALLAESYGLRVCILRIGLVLAPGGGFLDRLILPFKLALGGRLGHGKQWMSWVHRDDLLAIIDYLIKHEDMSGIFNATAPNPVTNLQFTQSLATVIHRPAILPVPEKVLRFFLGEMAILLIGGQRVIPSRLQKAGFTFKYPLLEDALADSLR